MELQQPQAQQTSQSQQLSKPPKKALTKEEQVKIKNDRKEILVQQNQKLKQQISELREQYTRVTKQKPAFRTEISPEVQQLNKEIDQAASLMQKYRTDITNMRRLVQSTAEQRVNELENKVKELQIVKGDLESESKSLLIIEKQQKQALGIEHDTSEFEQRIQALEKELKKQKQEFKELNNKFQNEEKSFKNQHQQFVDLDEKVKKLQIMKKQQKTQANEEEIPDVAQLEAAIQTLMEQKEKDEKQGRKTIQSLEFQITSAKNELDVLQVTIKEKEQTLRLNELKIRELKRTKKIVQQQKNKETTKDLENNTLDNSNLNQMDNSQDISQVQQSPETNKKHLGEQSPLANKKRNYMRNSQKNQPDQILNNSMNENSKPQKKKQVKDSQEEFRKSNETGNINQKLKHQENTEKNENKQ